MLLCIFCKAQCDTLPGVNIYSSEKPFDSLPSCWKDTFAVYIVYVDTTMTEGIRTIKVGNVYKNFRYRFPVNPGVKFKVGFGIKLKKDVSEMALINSNMNNLYQGFSFGKFLDEIGVPLTKNILVISAIGLHYDYGLPD